MVNTFTVSNEFLLFSKGGKTFVNFLTDEKIISSMLMVLPFNIVRNFEHVVSDESEVITVSISLFGDINRVLTIKGEAKMFSEFGKALYGMELDGFMLDSFASELWNMILGGIVTTAGTQGIDIDITTPSLSAPTTAQSEVYHLDVFNGEKIGCVSVFISEKDGE